MQGSFANLITESCERPTNLYVNVSFFIPHISSAQSTDISSHDLHASRSSQCNLALQSGLSDTGTPRSRLVSQASYSFFYGNAPNKCTARTFDPWFLPSAFSDPRQHQLASLFRQRMKLFTDFVRLPVAAVCFAIGQPPIFLSQKPCAAQGRKDTPA